MTTTIKKGTGRPAAAAKRTKAAQQQTKPVPADVQPGVPIDTTGIEKLSLGELRHLAHALGFSTATKEGKAALVRIIKANPAGPVAVAPKVRAAVGRRQAELANGKAAAKVRTFRPITPGLAGSGEDKCACVGELLKAAGWRVKVDGRKLSAQRGSERLELAWTEKGAHSADDSSYRASEDSKPKRVINVATALRFARGGAR